MSAKKILFPTDFSTASDSGLDQAVALAKGMDAELVILHVEEPTVAYGGGELYYGIPEPNREVLEKMLKAVVPKDPQVRCTHVMVAGDPATEIVRVAELEHAVAIVMATHGRTGLSRILMGSVAEQVLRRAPCPVMSVRVPNVVGQNKAS